MSSLKTFVILSFIFYVHCSPVSKIGLSDLILGELGPNDKYLQSAQSELHPIPGGDNVTSAIIDLGSEFVQINYVTVLEYGFYPDARAELLNGGPGYNYARIELIPGLSRGFNYTINVYGVELEKL